MMPLDKETIQANLKKPANYLPYWREIIIIFLIAGSIFLYWRFNEKNKALEAELARQDFIHTSGGINAGTAPVGEREKKVYPKIDADIATLNKNIKESKQKLEKLEKIQPTKEKSYAKFKNQDADSISKFLASRGYTNAVFTGISGR